MAKAKKQSSRGRKQDRARVAGGQDYEVRYTAKKTKRSAGAVKKAVKKVGSSGNRVERRLGCLERGLEWWAERHSRLPPDANLSPRRVSAVPLGPFSPFGNYLVLPAGLERD